MSVINKIKNFFGFGYIEDEDYAPDQYPDIGPTRQLETSDTTQSDDNDAPISVSKEMVLKIFDKVVEVTNASMPPYLAESLNTEKQKKFLYESLDASVKQYLSDLEEQANKHCQTLWKKERDQIKKEMDNLKQRSRDLEAKRTEINEQKLSAERQKRALSERVHDLENTILKIEAEKEQLEIENRSLINKAKVANVYEADMEEMRRQLEEYRSNTSDPEAVKENELLHKQIAELKAQLEQYSKASETSKVKDEMSGAMINDLQKRASEAQQAVKDAQQKINDLEAQIQLRDAQIDDLKKETAELEARIDEDEETFSQLQEIVEKVEMFEGIKENLETRVKTLKAQLKELKTENETLKTTIKNNIYAHAQEEKALRDQIDSLSAAR